MDEIPDDMQQGDVALLDTVYAEAGNSKAILSHFTDATAVFARKRDGEQAFSPGLL